MHARSLFVAAVLAASALPASAQSLRLPQRAEPGLDPSFARGWLAPTYDPYGFANFHWKDSVGFAPSSRLNWSYAVGERGSLGMSYSSGTYASGNYDPAALDGQRYGLSGRYALSSDWSVSAEALSHDPGSLFRLQDFRIGFQRRF
jgi:hypothetical protein